MEGSDTRPVYVYAGAMFDLRAKTNVEVTTVAFNTYKFTPIPVWLYMRPGGFGDVEDTLEGWTLIANTTVTGRGMGNPTYIPEGTFSPVLVRKGTKIGFYVTTDGPFLRSSMGTEQGKPYRANSDLVLYEGVGKRYPVENGSGAPRIFNGVVGYQYATIPTSSPTIDLGEFGIRVVEHTFPATDDTFVQRGVATGHGDMTQLRVDGVPERGRKAPSPPDHQRGPQAVRHRRLGVRGTVEAYPDGELDGSTATWDTVPYGTERGDAVGVVGSVHDPATGTQLERTGGVSSGTHYEVDIGRYLDANLSRTLVLAVRSDSDDGVMYRSSDSAPDGRGPALVVTFAYDPRDSPAMARTWGTDQPTSSPTVDPRWEDSVMPADAGRRFFNYDVGGVRGPESWGQAEDDGYYDQFRRLKTSRWSNKCGSGRRQSPRDVCQTNAKCQEFHETRPRGTIRPRRRQPRQAHGAHPPQQAPARVQGAAVRVGSARAPRLRLRLERAGLGDTGPPPRRPQGPFRAPDMREAVRRRDAAVLPAQVRQPRGRQHTHRRRRGAQRALPGAPRLLPGEVRQGLEALREQEEGCEGAPRGEGERKEEAARRRRRRRRRGCLGGSGRAGERWRGRRRPLDLQAAARRLPLADEEARAEENLLGPPRARGHLPVDLVLGVLGLDDRAPLLRGSQVGEFPDFRGCCISPNAHFAHLGTCPETQEGSRRPDEDNEAAARPAQAPHVRPRRPRHLPEDFDALRREQRPSRPDEQQRSTVPVHQERLRERRRAEALGGEEEGVQPAQVLERGEPRPVLRAGVSERLLPGLQVVG
ncbi:hypothetical protein THAOC_06561 [Thalassiosira oceanica]|uniref:Uncharacterized protein n=1 Tax=Thalassiosira oceanica TaxID=159749 RepID=K0T475_THAOC|nr:hypothetical protein THAOC_06561 [Thalassiosira oceanica]|eukprot:EJK71954.1 hypothetical protein THAOC_06561 [Thalassiosira oceanica]